MRGLLVWGIVATGCSQELVANTFTPDEWAKVKSTFAIDQTAVQDHKCSSPLVAALPGARPDPSTDATACGNYVRLGQEVFFDPAVSGEILFDDPSGEGHAGESGKVSCKSCHDPNSYYVDTRSKPGNVSFGTGFQANPYTAHNALSLVNVRIKDIQADANAPVMTWTGVQPYFQGVFENLALKKAMNSTPKILADAVRAKHLALYGVLFGCHTMDGTCDSDATIEDNVEVALDLYTRQLMSLSSRFDQYIGGNDAALKPDEEHGFELFVTTAACVECHKGYALTDFSFHSNGIDQVGPHVPADDIGLAKNTGNPDDTGLFLTPSLRNVNNTGPYMHAGQLATLDDVLEFYRNGGGPVETKDPRIVPLVDLDAGDIEDLKHFLLTLTGDAPDPMFGSVDPMTGLVTW
jgi:cytochrome c peroxidase